MVSSHGKQRIPPARWDGMLDSDREKDQLVRPVENLGDSRYACALVVTAIRSLPAANLERFLNIGTELGDTARLVGQWWRSVSVPFAMVGLVLCARAEAPGFLLESAGPPSIGGVIRTPCLTRNPGPSVGPQILL